MEIAMCKSDKRRFCIVKKKKSKCFRVSTLTLDFFSVSLNSGQFSDTFQVNFSSWLSLMKAPYNTICGEMDGQRETTCHAFAIKGKYTTSASRELLSHPPYV